MAGRERPGAGKCISFKKLHGLGVGVGGAETTDIGHGSPKWSHQRRTTPAQPHFALRRVLENCWLSGRLVFEHICSGPHFSQNARMSN